MGMWGYLHRVSAERLAQLLADPKQITDALYFPADDASRLPKCTVEKAWDAIQFMLARLAETGRIPPVNPVVGGRTTGVAFDYGDCWYRTPEEVRRIAEAIGGLTAEEFRQAYAPAHMAREGVYPDVWERTEEGEDNFEYVWGWFARDLVPFYREAAHRGEGMLLHLG